MFKITKTMHTETGHRLYNYNGKCAHFHGHRYEWSVTVGSKSLDSTGFVIDYKDLKGYMAQAIGIYDHAFLLCVCDPFVKLVGKDKIHTLMKGSNGEDARLIITDVNPTSENLISMAYKELKRLLPERIRVTNIKLKETENSFAEVSYE